jgi:hypothetical protein
MHVLQQRTGCAQHLLLYVDELVLLDAASRRRSADASPLKQIC